MIQYCWVGIISQADPTTGNNSVLHCRLEQPGLFSPIFLKGECAKKDFFILYTFYKTFSYCCVSYFGDIEKNNALSGSGVNVGLLARSSLVSRMEGIGQ